VIVDPVEKVELNNFSIGTPEAASVATPAQSAQTIGP
jgi:hypothetical protein